MYRFKIPDRWVDYTPFGETVADTRIIAVKTPLEQIFRRSEMVPDGLLSEQMFTPTQLVDGLLDRSHLLSLVIDLTNTTRYYDPKELQERGIDHVKIKCPGQTIPPDSVYKQFSSELERWLRQAKAAEVVAVHCTHGVNRTGYLICRYMMESKGFTYKAAVAAFNEARKHSIENQEYLDHLERGNRNVPHVISHSAMDQYEALLVQNAKSQTTSHVVCTASDTPCSCQEVNTFEGSHLAQSTCCGLDNRTLRVVYRVSCPPLPEPPLPPPPPQVAPRDTLPPNTDSQDSADNDMPSKKRPRCGESTGDYPKHRVGHGYPDPTRPDKYHRRDGGKQKDHAYGYHDNPYGNQSHCGPSQQWCLPWQHEPAHQWEPPRDRSAGRKSSKGQHTRAHSSKRS